MDIEKFQSDVVDGRKVLEVMLSEEGSKYKRMKKAFLMLYENDIKNGKQSEIGISFKKYGVITTLITASYLFPFLAKLSGWFEYVCYHEIGEPAYSYPQANQIKKGAGDISSISQSDIFGEILASTLCPLNIEEQIKMFETDTKSLKKSSRRIRGYGKVQINTVAHYYGRKSDGYVYGKELGEFYIDFLYLQKGFSIEQRKEAQLAFYDAVQWSILEKISGMSELKREEFSEVLFDVKRVSELLSMTYQNVKFLSAQ